MIPGAEYENMINHLLTLYSLTKGPDKTYFIEESCPSSLNLTFSFGQGSDQKHFSLPAKSFLRDLNGKCEILIVNGGS